MADHETVISTRYRDTDAMGHVNNAVYASFVEHAAIEFFAALLDRQVREVPFALVHLDLDFEGQVEVGDAVTSAVTVTDVGETSITFDHELRVEERVVARATAVRVAMDDDRASAIPVPDEWRERLADHRS